MYVYTILYCNMNSARLSRVVILIDSISRKKKVDDEIANLVSTIAKPISARFCN